MARPKKSKLNKDPEVVAKNKILTNLLNIRDNIESKLEINKKKFEHLDHHLSNDEVSIAKLNISSLHDLYAVENNKEIITATKIFKEITNLRKIHDIELEKLKSQDSKIEQARIDVLIAKVKCVLKTLGEGT